MDNYQGVSSLNNIWMVLLKVFNWGPLFIHELGPKATEKSMSFQAMAKKLLKSIWQRECNNPRDSANASTVTSPFNRYCIRLWHSGIQLQKVFSIVAESKGMIYISLSSYKRNTHTTWRKAKRLELCYLFHVKVVNSFNCRLEIWCRKIQVLGYQVVLKRVLLDLQLFEAIQGVF